MSKLNKSEVALSILVAVLANPSISLSDSIVDRCLEASNRILAIDTKETEGKYSIVVTEHSNELVVSGFMAQAIEDLHNKYGCTKFKLSVESGE